MKNLLFLLFLITGLSARSQVAINTDGTNPDNSAMLDVKSTDKGIHLPRLSLTERNAISSPATGLMVYQTGDTPGFLFGILPGYLPSTIPVSPAIPGGLLSQQRPTLV